MVAAASSFVLDAILAAVETHPMPTLVIQFARIPRRSRAGMGLRADAVSVV